MTIFPCFQYVQREFPASSAGEVKIQALPVPTRPISCLVAGPISC